MRVERSGNVVQPFANLIETRRRRTILAPNNLSEPLVLDLELKGGTKLSDCEITSFWGGRMGERWYGISLDLNLISS
jgi:hypothetical protein